MQRPQSTRQFLLRAEEESHLIQVDLHLIKIKHTSDWMLLAYKCNHRPTRARYVINNLQHRSVKYWIFGDN